MYKIVRGVSKVWGCSQNMNIHTSICLPSNHLSEKIVHKHWEEKTKFWLKKYEDLFGITKLSEMHERVIEAQQTVQRIQENRRKTQEEIFRVQNKLQEMQEVLHKTSMGDSMYISVVTQVHELIKEQKRLRDAFSLSDQTEREQQTTLALDINNSQDHERTYREKNKYISLICGIAGALAGLIGSSINNWRHRKDIKLFAGDISNQVTELQKHIQKQSSVTSSNPKTHSNFDVPKQTEIFLSEMQKQQEAFQDNIKVLHSFLNNNMLHDCEVNNGFALESQLFNRLVQLEENVTLRLNYNATLNVGLTSSLMLMCVFVIYWFSPR